MHEILETQRNALVDLCQRRGVSRLEVFGSATGGAFEPLRSDIDLLVDFDPHAGSDLFHRYFGLKQDLEALLGHKVDLVMVGALKNPYFIDAVNQTRRLIYAAPVTQTA